MPQNPSPIRIYMSGVSSGPTYNPFTYIQSNRSTDQIGVSLTGVAAGNLIVGMIGWEGTTTGDASCTDGTSSLTIGTRYDNTSDIDIHLQIAYLLSANAGNKTYTFTCPSGAAEKQMRVAEFSATGTKSLDQTNGATGGSSTTATSGSIVSASGNHLAFGGSRCVYNYTFSSGLIAGSAADGGLYTGSLAGIWWKSQTSQTSGTASATISTTDYWICLIASFISS